MTHEEKTKERLLHLTHMPILHIHIHTLDCYRLNARYRSANTSASALSWTHAEVVVTAQCASLLPTDYAVLVFYNGQA